MRRGLVLKDYTYSDFLQLFAFHEETFFKSKPLKI